MTPVNPTTRIIGLSLLICGALALAGCVSTPTPGGSTFAGTGGDPGLPPKLKTETYRPTDGTSSENSDSNGNLNPNEHRALNKNSNPNKNQPGTVQPASYQELPRDTNYATPRPLSRDAGGFVPGEPLGPAAIPMNPGLGYGNGSGFGDPGGFAGPGWNNTDPRLEPPSSSPPGSRPSPAPFPRDSSPGGNPIRPDSRSAQPLDRSLEELPPPRRIPEMAPPAPILPGTPDSRSAPESAGWEEGANYWSQPAWSNAESGRGYLARGPTLSGSVLRTAPTTATEIALTLQQENERLTEQTKFAMAAKARAEKRLAQAESELAKLRQQLLASQMKVQELTSQNQQLNQQLAASETEKEQIRKHSEQALQQIEATLDTVLLNTISPADKTDQSP